MTIAINGNRHQEGYFDDIQRLVDELLRRGDHVVMAEQFLDYLVDNLGSRFSLGIDWLPLTQTPKADLAISIGGDGAFLKTARWMGESHTPIAGINTGHLGYLSAFSFEKSDEIYDELLTGRYRIEQRSLLQAFITDFKPSPLTALNEFAITRSENASMINTQTIIDGASSLSHKGDGIIIATPTGSTAYNLSVGGPILDPTLAGWVLAPIAAHSLALRPMVIKDTSVLEITAESRGQNMRLAADGRTFSVPLSSKITICKAPYQLQLVQRIGHTFTDTLRDKLGMDS